MAIAVKPHIQHQLLDNYLEDALAIKIQTQQGPLIIGTIYQPPRRPHLPVQDILAILNHNIPAYIIGDLNANHTSLGYARNNVAGNTLVRLIHTNRLKHLGPHFPTFYSPDSATSPDIILSNHHAHHNTHFRQGDISTSDHLPIITRISTNPIQIPSPPRRNFHRANWEGFKQALLDIPTPPPLPLDAPTHLIDTYTERWYQDMQTAIDTHIPTSTHRTLPHYKDTHQLRLLKTQYTAIQQHAQIVGWNRQLYDQYIQLQRQIQHENTTLHNQLWETLTSKLCHNQRDPKQFFKAYKKLMGTNTQPTDYILDSNNTKLYTNQEMEREHRHYWTQNFQITPQDNAQFDQHTEQLVNTHIQQNLHLTTPTDTIDLTTLDANNPLTRPISLEEVSWAISTTKNKAPGPSKINKTILHHTPNSMRQRIQFIFNMALASGHWPRKFKHAHIRLITKPDKPPHLVTSKRPISLLEVPGKLLEKIINKRLRDYLEDNDIFDTRQYGFRPHRGTEHALAVAYEDIALSQSTRHKNNVIFRDVSKAFDKVWFRGLQYKLLKLELPANITRLLCDFLVGRTASITLNNYIGPPIHLLSGVPQGAILSPTLYILYTHDTPPPNIPHDNYIKYADDITQTITYPTKSKHMMLAKTTHAITTMNTYENKWKIKTNTDKFTLVPISRQLNSSLDVHINNTQIHYENTGKLLGLTITPWGISKHIRQKRQQALATLTRLKRFTSCTTQTKLRLYTSIIRPTLEYPPIPLNTMSITQLQQLQSVQNKAIRWATNTRWPTRITNEHLHTLHNIPPLNTRIHTRAQNIWKTLQALEDPLFTSLHDRHTDTPHYRTHRWWPRSLFSLTANPPPPYYTRRPPRQDNDPDMIDSSDDEDDDDDREE